MTLLVLAVLFGAPERVVVVARKADPPGLLERLRKPVARAFHRLYEREDDDVARGNALAAEDDPEGALREYDKARVRRPDDPRVAFDRATVLLKMDAKAAPLAAAEASQALQRGDAELKPKAAYDLALASEAMGRAEDAIRQYGDALTLDPFDVDSKVNLELLLRSQQQSRQSSAGKPEEKQPSKQGEQGKPQPKQGDASHRQEQARPQDPNPAPQQEPAPQQDPEQAQKQPQEQRQQATPPDKPVDRSEAERLLDALRASEKQLQPWRFAQKKTEMRKRSDPEKDW